MAVMFPTKFSKVEAAVPRLSTYWKRWSATMQSNIYFHMKELSVLTDLLRLCARQRFAIKKRMKVVGQKGGQPSVEHDMSDYSLVLQSTLFQLDGY